MSLFRKEEMIMQKRIAVFMLAVLLAAMLGTAVYASDAGIGIGPGETMPDFTVSLTDGTTATLSGMLEENDLVVLNVFTSWCGPCEREFPEMEEVYLEKKDRMEILSISGDPADTMEIIAQYKESHGLTFPMGLKDDSPGVLKISAFPTSIFIDRSGKVGFIKVGAFPDKKEFEDKVDYFLSPDYDGKPLESEKAFSFMPYILGWMGISGVLLLIGRWGILRKAGRKGWHSLIPFLNVYDEYSTVWNGWMGVLADMCLPLGFACNMAKLPAGIYYALLVIGFVIGMRESISLAKAFGKGRVFGILMGLPVFREIGRLILGVGRARYRNADS